MGLPSRMLQMGWGNCLGGGVLSHAADFQSLFISPVSANDKDFFWAGLANSSSCRAPARCSGSLLQEQPCACDCAGAWLAPNGAGNGEGCSQTVCRGSLGHMQVFALICSCREKPKKPSDSFVLVVPYPAGILGASRSKLFHELNFAAWGCVTLL